MNCAYRGVTTFSHSCRISLQSRSRLWRLNANAYTDCLIGRKGMEVVDLSFDSDGEGSQQQKQKAHREADQRHLIMRMATAVNAQTGRGGPAAAKADLPKAGDNVALPLAKRQRSRPSPEIFADATSVALDSAATSSHGPAAPSSNSLLAALHAERRARQQTAGWSQDSQNQPKRKAPGAQPHASSSPVKPADNLSPEDDLAQPAELSLLSYNVWFEEGMALEQRMAAIGRIIEDANYPDVVMFQEVTHNIVGLWRKAAWWGKYSTSPLSREMPYFTMLCIKKATLQLSASGFVDRRFSYSRMGRGLLLAECRFQGRQVLVATSHLESPIPGDKGEAPRLAQYMEAIKQLQQSGVADTILAGDLNWTSSTQPPLPAGWCDAWSELRPGQKGFTYDGPGNAMLSTKWQNRFDRFIVSLPNFELQSIKLVGKDRLPDVTYIDGRGVTRPVLPSDHFGVLLQLRSKAAAAGSGLHRLG